MSKGHEKTGSSTDSENMTNAATRENNRSRVSAARSIMIRQTELHIADTLADAEDACLIRDRSVQGLGKSNGVAPTTAHQRHEGTTAAQDVDHAE